MSNENNTFKQTSIRLPAVTLDRANALVDAVREDPLYGGLGTVKRADVLRLALAKGLDVLERELLEDKK